MEREVSNIIIKIKKSQYDRIKELKGGSFDEKINFLLNRLLSQYFQEQDPEDQNKEDP